MAEYVHTLLREGTSADRQLGVHQRTGSLEAVVDHLAEETLVGVREGPSQSGPHPVPDDAGASQMRPRTDPI